MIQKSHFRSIKTKDKKQKKLRSVLSLHGSKKCFPSDRGSDMVLKSRFNVIPPPKKTPTPGCGCCIDSIEVTLACSAGFVLVAQVPKLNNRESTVFVQRSEWGSPLIRLLILQSHWPKKVKGAA